jgi:hypothetical protein
MPAFTASVGFTSDSGPPLLKRVHLEDSGLKLLTAFASVEVNLQGFSIATARLLRFHVRVIYLNAVTFPANAAAILLATRLADFFDGAAWTCA